MSKRLFVGGLSWNTDEGALRAAFEPFGEVSEVKVIVDRETGRSRGFGFVGMADDSAADAAVQAMNGAFLDGRTLRVNEAEDRRSGPGGPPGPRPDRGPRPPRFDGPPRGGPSGGGPPGGGYSGGYRGDSGPRSPQGGGGDRPQRDDRSRSSYGDRPSSYGDRPAPRRFDGPPRGPGGGGRPSFPPPGDGDASEDWGEDRLRRKPKESKKKKRRGEGDEEAAFEAPRGRRGARRKSTQDWEDWGDEPDTIDVQDVAEPEAEVDPEADEA